MNTSVPMPPIPGSRRPPVARATYMRDCNPEQLIKVSIYARRNPQPAASALKALDKLRTAKPRDRKYLNSQDFEAVFGANQDDLEKIKAFAQSAGLRVVESSPSNRRVVVEGTIANVSRAFGVELKEYQHPEFGQFRGRDGVVHTPTDLAGIIEGVFGLDTRPVGKPRRRRGKLPPVDWRVHAGLKTNGAAASRSSAGVANPFPGAFFPPDVAELYNYSSDATGQGQNVAIFAFNGPPSPDPRGGYSLPALNSYFQNVLGAATSPQITDVVIQGPGNDPGPDTRQSEKRGDSTGEVMLDMCVVGSVAPGANIFMYFTEFNSQGWVDAIHQAVTDDNQISVISISYGNPEDGPDTQWSKMGITMVDQAFEAAAAKGITICCTVGRRRFRRWRTVRGPCGFPRLQPECPGRRRNQAGRDEFHSPSHRKRNGLE